LTYQRSIFRKSPSSLALQERRSRELRYVWAATLVAAGLLVGFELRPLLGPGHAYDIFYPVVLVCAYSLGARPAALATVLSAVVAYWCFVPPPFQWKFDADAGRALGVFLGVSALAILLMGKLVRRLEELGNRQGRAEALVRTQAETLRALTARGAGKPAEAAVEPLVAAPERSFQPNPQPTRAASLH
jgi:K+-sensing histidine kinase KdpD